MGEFDPHQTWKNWTPTTPEPLNLLSPKFAQVITQGLRAIIQNVSIFSQLVTSPASAESKSNSITVQTESKIEPS